MYVVPSILSADFGRLGEKEQENNEISIRKQGEGDQGTMKIATFAAQITAEVGDMMNRWEKEQRN